MKISFVQPRTIFGNTWEALNVGYIAAYLKKHGYTDVNFYSGFFDSDEDIVRGCAESDIVGFSCTSPQLKHALRLAERIKRKNNDSHIVLGGVHPSVLPDECLENTFVDAVVIGEGETAFLDIVEGNRGKKVKHSFVKDLDVLPFPDRMLIKQERNILQAYRDNGIRIASMLASRGCPFSCTFCASHSVWTRQVRFRSADNILEEFKQTVKDLRIDFVKFSDDTFTVNEDLITDFCEKKIKNGIKTPWGANIRADAAGKGLLKLMKQAGCKEVWIGVESGSPDILKQMKKGVDLEKVRSVFKEAKEQELFTRAYMLLGMPEESLDDIKLSEKIVDEVKPDMVGFTILAPYPGTAYYDAELHKDTDWEKVDEYGNRLTITKFLSNEDLHREQQRLVKKYQANIAFRQKRKDCA